MVSSPPNSCTLVSVELAPMPDPSLVTPLVILSTCASVESGVDQSVLVTVAVPGRVAAGLEIGATGGSLGGARMITPVAVAWGAVLPSAATAKPAHQMSARINPSLVSPRPIRDNARRPSQRVVLA